jgi:DNA-binding MarR family transcriptional regulator
MNRKEKISLIHEGLRQVMAPLWHSSRANIHQIVSERYGITTSQFHTLRRIMNGRTSVSELADCLHVSQPNVSRAVDELVQKGYVIRERMQTDRRKLELSLTLAAESLFANIHKELDNLLEKNFDSLSDNEIEKLFEAIEILKKVTTPQPKE